MSTTACQSVQSCFDTLTLKLNPPNMTQKSPSMDSAKTGWSCIESLSNASSAQKESSDDKFEVYVHPLDKRSKSMLSDKSLEMCTENLGSESGTDITEDDDIFSMMSLSSDTKSERSYTSSRTPRYHKIKEEPRQTGYESLPPPLTTMCGANTISVRPHRESGRLVMTAVTTSPRKASIYAERCNGRLTMSLSDDCFSDEEEEEEEVNDEIMPLIDGGGELEEEEESVEEEQEEESLEEGMDGISKEVGEKFGISEFQWLSRCKEDGRGTRRLINWETFCVAT